MKDERLDDIAYDVVINSEGQYSIWLASRRPPTGWERAGFRGNRGECLEHVSHVWTDLRPLSLRQRLEALTADGMPA